MFGAATFILGMQLLAVALADPSVNFMATVDEKDHCPGLPAGVVCRITELLDGLRNLTAINPVKISDVDTSIVAGHTRLDVVLNSCILEGVPGFVIEELNYNVATFRLRLKLLFPSLDISAPLYKINGVVAGVLLLSGEGPLRITFGGATLDAYARIPFVNPAVTGLVADIRAESFTFQMDNFLGELSDAFNEMMSEIGLDILNVYKEAIDNWASAYLEKLLNNLISGGSLDELVANIDTEEILAGVAEKIMKLVESKLNSN